MRSFLKVGVVVMLAVSTVGACDSEGVRHDKEQDFDADAYVEEEFRDFFEIEEKAGAAHRLPEQTLLPNVA